MIVHALRGCGMDPSLPGRRRGALDRVQRRLGSGGVAGRRGRRVRPLAAEARAEGRGAHERRARPPRDLRLPARRRRDVPGVPGAWPSTWCSDPASSGSRRESGGAGAASSSTRAARASGSTGRACAPGAGPAQRPQRRGGARRVRARRRGAGPGRRRAGRLHRRRPPLRAARHDTAGALVVDDYAHHPTEVRATLAAARTLDPRRVVAVFQPHLFSRTRHQYREFGAALAARRPRRRARRLPGARARRGLPRRHRPARRRRGGRRRPRPPRRLAAAARRRRALPARRAARRRPAAHAGRGRRRRARAAAPREPRPRRRRSQPSRSEAPAAATSCAASPPSCCSPGWSGAAGCGCATPRFARVRPRSRRHRRATASRIARRARAAARAMTTLHVRAERARRRRRVLPVGRRAAGPEPTSRTGCRSRCSSTGRSRRWRSTAAASRSRGGGLVLTGVHADRRPALDPARLDAARRARRRPAHARCARRSPPPRRSALLARSRAARVGGPRA